MPLFWFFFVFWTCLNVFDTLFAGSLLWGLFVGLPKKTLDAPVCWLYYS